jgi:hypothetical protein
VKALALALVLTVGCSWLFVESPPAADPLPDQLLTCTDTNFYPAADLVGAYIFGSVGITALLTSLLLAAFEQEEAGPVFAVGAATGAAGGLYLWSGIDGALDTSRCKELRMKTDPSYGRPLK